MCGWERAAILGACLRPRVSSFFELELELIQTQMTQKPMLRAEVYARALRASQTLKSESGSMGGRAMHLMSERVVGECGAVNPHELLQSVLAKLVLARDY